MATATSSPSPLRTLTSPVQRVPPRRRTVAVRSVATAKFRKLMVNPTVAPRAAGKMRGQDQKGGGGDVHQRADGAAVKRRANGFAGPLPRRSTMRPVLAHCRISRVTCARDRPMALARNRRISPLPARSSRP